MCLHDCQPGVCSSVNVGTEGGRSLDCKVPMPDAVNLHRKSSSMELLVTVEEY